jgi:tetratricopeptide (TPR) repeat protein
MKRKATIKKSALVFACLLLVKLLSAQTALTMPQASQKAMVMQRIGLTDITISYHAPLVKGRKIWGDLVPYNEVWRAGANENTTISFTSDVKVEGKTLAAGTYGLHMIPTENDWTIIFSKNSTSWGSFFYDKTEDALRVNVKPVAANDSKEELQYHFSDIKPNSAVITLRWEKLKIPFNVDVDVNEVVYQNMKNELRNVQGFTWEAPLQAARFCMNNKIHTEDAMKWVDQSIQTQETFGNLMTKSKLLAAKGDNAEADKLSTKAMTIADEAQLNTYGYDLVNQKKMKDAIEIFKTNVKRHPESWNVYDSLGEAYGMDGNKKDAVANYKLALAKSPANQKERIQKAITKLEEK